MSITLDCQRVVEYDWLPSDEQLSLWIHTAVKEQRPDAEVTIRITDQEESQQLNFDYRGKNKPTNVLSFPFEAPEHIQLPLLGDLVICAQVVEQEAKNQHKELESHWAHMVIHGCLHLLGYDHAEDHEAEQMEQLEVALMSELGYNNPYDANNL